MKTISAPSKSVQTPKEKIVTLGFQAEGALAARVDREAERSNVSRSDVLRWAVLAWVTQREKKLGVR